MTLLLLLLAPACAPEPPPVLESEGRPAWEGEWVAAHGAVVVQDQREVAIEQGDRHVVLATSAVGSPALSADGTRLVLAHEGAPIGLSVIDAVTIGREGVDQRRLVEGGSPDRVAIDAPGERVVYVNGTTGIASVWVVPFEGGAPTQLTNQGIEPAPGSEPEGFVPPPHRGPLRVEGEVVRWSAPDGEHEVTLP